MSAERSIALRGLLRRVQEIAETTEDEREIRSLIAEAGVQPGAHCGNHELTDDEKVEWVLGQWADMIDHDSLFLNTARNISAGIAVELCGYEPGNAGPRRLGDKRPWILAELVGVVDRIGGAQ